MENLKLIKVTTNVGEYDVKISLAEFDALHAEAIEKGTRLTLSLGEVRTNYRGESYNDNVKIHLNLQDVKILSVEEHDMVLNVVTPKK